jgi:ferredoxin
MRVRVSTERCQGHNRCVSLAPELFEVDEHGVASATATGRLSHEEERRARLAAANCPEEAVELIDDDRGERE